MLAVRERADELRELAVDRDMPGVVARAFTNLPVLAADHRPRVTARDAANREVDVVLDRQTAEQPRLLVGSRQAELRPVASRHLRVFCPVHLDRPLSCR